MDEVSAYGEVMCTILFRVHAGPDAAVLMAAVRDEFLDRPWSLPDRHWPDPNLVGGLDLISGGTWLAVRTDRSAAAVLVNGPGEIPENPGSRGALPLRMLRRGVPTQDDVANLPGFHLLHAEPGRAQVVSWDGHRLQTREVPAGNHTLTYGGLDDLEHARVRRFLPKLAGLADDAWRTLLEHPEPSPAAQEALLVNRLEAGRPYGSTSAALVSVRQDGLTYDFTADPQTPETWLRVTDHVRNHR
ncbi:NRDE family protein [Streptomyces sp. B-S-A8]|uniref:NRDE family protein n=1 Tax=Streptomyces solicavernae TaxID=3043614 RepID=A0ABT6RY22_9ACTN|nr:NRDE family protein [Streptomyces sp. B-S-A8]MDI3389341.1 NRDE family protein [Streptomyces sp. B-S-A8]